MNTVTTTTTQKSYVCNGTCGASVTQEQFQSGLNVCGTDGCTMKGHPLVEKVTETTETAKTGEDDVIINNG